MNRANKCHSKVRNFHVVQFVMGENNFNLYNHQCACFGSLVFTFKHTHI